MSQEPLRRSSRPSTVTKREELEKELSRRQIASEVKVLKSRSTAIGELHGEELKLFAEEARRLSELVDRILDEDSDPLDNSKLNQSLVWDSHESTTSPSFVTGNSSQVSLSVQEIIEEVLSKSVTEGDEENLVINQIDTRRNTSTDENFLTSSPVEDRYQRQVNFPWPPRFPSQEPEDYSHFYYPPLQPRLEENYDIDEEVFEGGIEERIGTMDQEEYDTRYRAVKLAKMRVQDVKKKFTANDVTSMHVKDYRSRLNEISDKLDDLNDVAGELIVDLDEENAEDKVKIDNLEILKAELLDEVKGNEREVEEKVKSLIEAQPLTKAEQEDLDLKKQKILLENQEKEDEKIVKNMKAEIALSNLSSQIKNLMGSISEVKLAKELSDEEVKEILPEVKKLEEKLEKLTESKVKLDIELAGLKLEATMSANLEEDFKAVTKEVKKKVTDLTVANKERRLFALSKQVKDVAAYPETFSGKSGENVYRFFVLMKKALDKNQVAEEDRVRVLMKHLGGSAKGLMDESFKTLAEAEKSLKARYGSPSSIWEGSLENFKKRCINPKAWSSRGSGARCDVIAQTIKFLGVAEQLVEDYGELKSAIYSKQTIETFTLVLPIEIMDKAKELELESNPELNEEGLLKQIKARLLIEEKKSVSDSHYPRAIEENKKSFSAQFNGFKDKKDSTGPPPKKKFDSDHDCKGSSTCKTDWGGLGCSELYKLRTVEERKNFLYERRLCMKCGQDYFKNKSTHEKFRCFLKSSLTAVKCTKPRCNFGAATCPSPKHQGSNASQELKDWLDAKNIKTTVSTIYSQSCKARNCSPPPDTNVSSKEAEVSDLTDFGLYTAVINQEFTWIFGKGRV